jgi:hypothetical protein
VTGSLCRVAGQLAAFAAKAWAGTGDARRARDWWRTARQAADRSGCVQTRMWVRGSTRSAGRPLAALPAAEQGRAEATELAARLGTAG